MLIIGLRKAEFDSKQATTNLVYPINKRKLERKKKKNKERKKSTAMWPTHFSGVQFMVKSAIQALISRKHFLTLYILLPV